MRKGDLLGVRATLVAVVADAAAVFFGYMLATWVRFNWLPLFHGNVAAPVDVYGLYSKGAAVGSLLTVLVFRSLGLYTRPQIGRFENKIPRIIRAVGLGVLLTIVAAYIALNYYSKISNLMFAVSFVTISFLVLLERYVLFRLELHYVRHSEVRNKVLILGADNVASHVRRSISREPGLQSDVVGFLRTDLSSPDEDIDEGMIKGAVEDLSSFVTGDGKVDQVILADATLPHARILDIMVLCERNMVAFNIVPDLFRVLTTSVGVRTVGDIPLLGVVGFPLDNVWNRALKRTADIAGSLVGLVIAAPIIAVAAVFVRRSSPGPVFYRQERCGEHSKIFTLYKLRTMPVDAEAESGPVWAEEDDPRRTKVGAVLRQYNLDELPQLWNVLVGDMSLVGPRPERPHFVEQFKEEIGRYMSRHASKPGITGWAQVNGLRGNTSIEERIKYDLYYLENWSLAFDFKILLQTLLSRENAY